MADYMAECGEHLTAVRRTLLAVELTIGRTTPERRLLDDLFHAFHSLKGLSGMVGFKEAEELAHEMESFLRGLQVSPVPLTPDGYAALADATGSLEVLIASVAAPQTRPDIRAVVDGLTDHTPELATRRQWRLHYRPTPDLAARGVSINTVRAALQTIGEIVEATPKIGAAGEISFEFVVTSDADDEALGLLEQHGVRRDAQQLDAVLPAVEGPRPVAGPGAIAAAQFVRVGVTRLDELMRLMGDLVVTRARLADALGAVEAYVPAALWRRTEEHTVALERQLRELRDGVMRVRMVPVGDVFERMSFIARDLARQQGKRVRLEIRGAGTELDKFVVERLSDPLLHLVRNALSHGVETPHERRDAGKAEEAVFSLRAATAGDTAVIEIEDDGRGIDPVAVAERARRAGLAVPPDPLDNDVLLDLISAPGLSTRDSADRASGRGIGMAVVRRMVGEMGGIVSLDTRVGRGTRFTVELPLTLAITDALIALVADRTFAVPQGTVREVIEVASDSIRRLEGAEVVAHRGRTLPIVRLSQQFSLASVAAAHMHVFVAGTTEAPVGLAVDRVVGQREIVVRTFTDPLVKVPGIAGATQLGDGRVVLILDVAALIKTSNRSRS
jgi:two-component system, chemotaxis family, sensor kinase CheA